MHSHFHVSKISALALAAFALAPASSAVTGGPGSPFCFGDGTGTACPCGNSGAAGNGCMNSVPLNTGANLTATGAAKIGGGSTLVLNGSAMPPSSTCLYFQGTMPLAAGLGAPFGDGLRCVTGNLRRLAIRFNVGGASSVGPGLDVLGGITLSGTVIHYQVWYRDAAVFCTASPFNLTNGWRVVWV